MKHALVCLLVILFLQLLTPFWWWILVVPLLYCFLFLGSGRVGFRVGIGAAGTAWLGASVFLLLTGSDIIAGRMAVLFHMGSPWILALITGFVAALGGGVSGMTGGMLKDVLTKNA